MKHKLDILRDHIEKLYRLACKFDRKEQIKSRNTGKRELYFFGEKCAYHMVLNMIESMESEDERL